MATLVLKEMRCVVDTGESGSDSPYFIVFVGYRTNTPKCSVKVVREAQWHPGWEI